MEIKLVIAGAAATATGGRIPRQADEKRRPSAFRDAPICPNECFYSEIRLRSSTFSRRPMGKSLKMSLMYSV